MDEDGMLDGEEIIRCDVKDGFFYTLSDPEKSDTDEDGFDDYYDPEPLYKNNSEDDLKLSDVVYDGKAEIYSDVQCRVGGNWGNAKATIKFDKPSQIKKMDKGNICDLRFPANIWEIQLADGVDPQSVKYTVIIENKGKEIFRKKSTLSAPKVEYSTKLYMRTGEKNAIDNIPVYFKYTSKYAKTSDITVTSGRETVSHHELKGSDARKYEFTNYLSAQTTSNFVYFLVNKGLDNEYSQFYRIDTKDGAEHTYPISREKADEEEATAEDNTKLLTAVGNTNGGCNLAVTVEDPEARNVYIKIQDENRKIVGTSSTVDEFDAMNFRSTFAVKNGANYTITAIVNKGMHSEKSILKTVYVDSGEDIDSDGDSYYDYEDANPYVKAENGIYNAYEKNPKFTKYNNYYDYKIENEIIQNLIRIGNQTYASVQNYDAVYVDAVYRILIAQTGVYDRSGFNQAANALKHYLFEGGCDYEIDVKSLVNESKSAKEFYNWNIERLKEHIESVLIDQGSLVIASSNTNIDIQDKKYSGYNDLNWICTIGDCHVGGIVAKASRNGAIYSLSFKYMIQDYYDWDSDKDLRLGSITRDSDNYQLHAVGYKNVRNYFIYGYFEDTITWERK